MLFNFMGWWEKKKLKFAKNRAILNSETSVKNLIVLDINKKKMLEDMQNLTFNWQLFNH